jgi:hypothetical protein
MAFPCRIAQALQQLLLLGVSERDRRIVAVHRNCGRVGALAVRPRSATRVSDDDVGDTRHPRCGRSPSQSYQPGQETGASRISSAGSRVLLAVDPERVRRLVGQLARRMIRRRVRVESDHFNRCLPPRGGDWALVHTGLSRGASPASGESDGRELLESDCEADVTVM